MAAPSQYYVDPNGGNDTTGDGTALTPWKTIQKALNTISQDETNGDQINLKAGTDDVLASALSLASYGTPTATARLIIRGYTTTANDGGRGQITYPTGSNIFLSSGYDYITLLDLWVHDVGTASSSVILQLDNNIDIQHCKFSDCTGKGVYLDNYCTVRECEFTDCAGDEYLNIGFACTVINNYFLNHATNKPTRAIFILGQSCIVDDNIVSVDGATHGVVVSNVANVVRHNTIYGGGSGTGSGILFDAADHDQCSICGNIICGFAGVGGKGVDFGSATVFLSKYGHNAFYNNTTNESNVGDALAVPYPSTPDNEELESEVIAKSGDNTYANRLIYFAPLGVGNLWQGSGVRDKGGVQHVDAGGGGYTYGDEDASKVLTTATGTGTYQPVAAADVQAGVAVGVSPAVGTFAVPAEADVKAGTKYGNAAEFTGSYPTTATSKAAQLADDKAAVAAAKASILDTETILTIAGTFDLAAAKAAAASAQHATDAAFLETNKDEIIPDGTDILGEFGVTGTAVVGGGPLVGPSALVSC